MLSFAEKQHVQAGVGKSPRASLDQQETLRGASLPVAVLTALGTSLACLLKTCLQAHLPAHPPKHVPFLANTCSWPHWSVASMDLEVRAVLLRCGTGLFLQTLLPSETAMMV